MSETNVLWLKETWRPMTSTSGLLALVILATTFAMSRSSGNCPFLTLTTLPVAPEQQQIGLPAQERWNLQDVDGLRHIGAFRGIVHVGQYGHAM
jgi:hypothetical protein